MERTQLRDSALIITQPMNDVLARVPRVPVGDDKVVRQALRNQTGGNGATSGLALAMLGFKPDIIGGVGSDDAGRKVEADMHAAGVFWHPRMMEETPLSIIIVNPEGRAIISPPDDLEYTQDFPRLDLEGCRIVHVDGRQLDAAKHYVMQEAPRYGVDVTCDFGRDRPGQNELLPFITHPAVSKRYCDDMRLGVDDMLEQLRRHSKTGIVTQGAQGLRYFVGKGEIQHMDALYVHASDIVDENGSGDIFNGARLYSMLTWPERPFESHLLFAMAAVTCKLKHFGNTPPTLDEVRTALRTYNLAIAA